MEVMKKEAGVCFLALFLFWARSCDSSAYLTPKGVNPEVQALMNIKDSLVDPRNVLEKWDRDSVDPCSWAMVSCSPEYLVVGLASPSQNFSGTLSPSIGNLTNLQILLLQNNNITGPIPKEIGKLTGLHTFDISNNFLTGEVPNSLGHLKGLQYLRLNNNSLFGPVPLSLANMSQLAFLDFSYNNLSGPISRFPARTFNIVGNPLICATGKEQECYGTTSLPLSFNLTNSQSQPSGKSKSHKLALALGSSLRFQCCGKLGAGNADRAKNAVAVTLKLSIFVGLTVVLSLLLGHNIWASAFSNSPEIKKEFTSMTPLLAISILLDSAQGILSGVARGCGWQHLAALTNLIVFYVIDMTIAILVGFLAQLYAKGLWIGLICGLFCQACTLLIITLRINWTKLELSVRNDRERAVLV